MTTITELESFLQINHPELNNVLIKNFGKYSNDGFGLEKSGNLFVWFHYEKNNRENLNYFKTEESAVEFAYSEIKKLIEVKIKKN